MEPPKALRINVLATGRKWKGHTNSADNARSFDVAVLSFVDIAAADFLPSAPPRASTADPVSRSLRYLLFCFSELIVSREYSVGESFVWELVMGRRLPRSLVGIIRDAGDAARCDESAGPSLLKRFAHDRDGEAFRDLVHLYAPLVWGVCRRWLRDANDAEDAFQATFIVLARKAGSVAAPDRLPAWLHGVAARCARKVGESTARKRELPGGATPDLACEVEYVCPDLRFAIDDELSQLPENLRRVVVLCHIEGRSCADAARVLGCLNRTAAYRLKRAEALLKSRLERRGLAPASLLAGLVAARGGASELPAGVAERAAVGALGVSTDPTVAVATANAVIRGLSTQVVRRGSAIAILLAVGVGVWVAVGLARETPRPVAPNRPVTKTDLHGEPLPTGALARIGSMRFRPEQSAGPGDVAYLPDGKSLISVHGTAGATFWDASTGRESRRLEGPAGSRLIRIAGDGRSFAVAGDNQVWIWDLEPEGPKLRWKWSSGARGVGGSITALAWSADRSRIAVGDAVASCTRVLDATNGETAATMSGTPGGLAYEPEGKSLAVSFESKGDGTAGERYFRANRIALWDQTTGQIAKTFDAPEGTYFTDFLFSPEGKTLTWIGSERACQTLDVASGEVRSSWTAEAYGTNVAYLPGGTELIQIWPASIDFRDAKSGKVSRPRLKLLGLPEPNAMRGSGNGCRLAPDGKHLATCVASGVTTWDLKTGRPTGPDPQLLGFVPGVAFSRDGKIVATFADRAAEVRLWDASTGEPVGKLATGSTKEGQTFGFGWNAREEIITLQRQKRDGNSSLSLVTWDRATGEARERFPLPDDVRMGLTNAGLAPFAVSADGKRVALGGGNHLHLFDSAGKLIERVDLGGAIERLSLSPDLGAAFSTTLNLTANGPAVVMNTWDIRHGRPFPASLPSPTFEEAFHTPTFSPDGRWLAAVNANRAIVLTEVATNATGQQFANEREIYATAFSSDGRFLAAGGVGGRVAIWDLASGKVCRTFAGHRGGVTSLAFSPDGTRLVSGAEDETALVWDTAGLRAPIRDVRPTAELVEALIGSDAAAAHRAELALAERPTDAIPRLAAQLKPTAPEVAVAVQKWIADLDDASYATRTNARNSLLGAGSKARPAIAEAMANASSPEARARLDALIKRLDTETVAGAVRGVAALERIGTAESRRVLEDLAKWKEGGAIAREAGVALARMPKP